MRRGLTIALFVASLVLGYVAFAVPRAEDVAAIDALFLIAVVGFVASLLGEMGRRLRESVSGRTETSPDDAGHREATSRSGSGRG